MASRLQAPGARADGAGLCDAAVRVALAAPRGAHYGAAQTTGLVAVRSGLRFSIRTVFLLAALPCAAQSKWAHLDANGKLVYAHTPAGDRIADFSYAGYHGGGVALPDVEAKRKVAPTGADDTAAIQTAIDEVSKLPLVNGHRGAVELTPGIFHCTKTLTISASGVVLRGAGWNDKTGTLIVLSDAPHLGISIEGKMAVKALGATTITDAYTPSGTKLIHVADASAIHPGDTLQIVKANTPAWLKFMGMDKLERPGVNEHWIGEGLKVLRRVAAVKGNAVTLEVPLTDNIDAKFLDGTGAPVTRVSVTGQISEDGIEGLRIVAPAESLSYQLEAEFDGIRMNDVVDSWLSDGHLEDTTNSIRIESGTERLTIERVDVQQKFAVTTAAKNFQFSSDGTQILFDHCSGKGDGVFYFATQARQQGPVVVLHCRFEGNGRIEPHQRWSTGLLVDECEVPNGGKSRKYGLRPRMDDWMECAVEQHGRRLYRAEPTGCGELVDWRSRPAQHKAATQ
jgi:hypothetical protein